MSVFKPLGPTDVTLQKREVNKDWEITSSSYSDLGLSTRVFQIPSEETLLTLGTPTGSLFHSVKHLYYSNFLNEGNIASGSFENYIQTSLFKNKRELQTGSFGQVISVPKQVFGEFIVPESIDIRDKSFFKYVETFEDHTGVLTVTHNLNEIFPFYVTYETRGGIHEEIIPQEFEIIDENTIELTFPNTDPVTGKVIIFVMKKVILEDDGNGKMLSIIEDELQGGLITDILEVGDVIYTHGNILLQKDITQPKPFEIFPFSNETDFTLTHTLETENPVVIVYNDENRHIIPQEIIYIGNNQVRLIFPITEPVSGTVVLGRPTEGDFRFSTFTAPSGTNFINSTTYFHEVEHNLGTSDLFIHVFKVEGTTRKRVIPKTVDTSDPNKLLIEVTNPGDFEVAVYNGVLVGTPFPFPTSNGSIELTNSLTLKTLRATAKVESAEFNFTSNPSALSLEKEEGVIAQSGGGLRDPKLTPYMTTVGLYNDRDELIAVAKVPRPVPISPDIETTFKIEIDL